VTNLDTSKLLALKLSSLNEADFNWVYSQLHDDIKNDLDPIIREIKQIGFEIDVGTINKLIKRNGFNDVNLNVRDVNIKAIDELDYEDIAEVFKSEPSFLLNTIISMSDWKWLKDPNFIDKPKTGSTKVIKNIKSKDLLRNSIISWTVFFMQSEENTIEKHKEISKFQYVDAFSSYLNKIIRSSKKWMF
jgi:hypothetical protein